MRIGALATMVFALLIGFPFASMAGLAPDGDSDGTPDVLDFCSADSTAPTPKGCDTDSDGYGNACDSDYNDDGDTDINDFFGTGQAGFFPLLNTGPGLGDMDCDGDTDVNDFFNGFFPRLNAGGNGPSGLGCAGTPPCP